MAAPAATSGTVNPVAQFTVNFVNDGTSVRTTSPRNAFLAAVNIWSHEVQSAQTLTIDVHATTFADPAVLGAAGPGEFLTGSDANVAYPLSYLDAQRTTRLDPANPDIYAEFNPARLGLYFGTDGRPPSSGVDFESVVLHEIGHGLGLVGPGVT